MPVMVKMSVQKLRCGHYDFVVVYLNPELKRRFPENHKMPVPFGGYSMVVNTETTQRGGSMLYIGSPERGSFHVGGTEVSPISKALLDFNRSFDNNTESSIEMDDVVETFLSR